MTTARDPREIIREALEQSSNQDDEGAMWLTDREYPDAAERVYDSLCEAGLLTTSEVVAAIRAATGATSDPRWTPELVYDLARVIDAESSDWILNAPREAHGNPGWRMDVRTARAVLRYLADRGLLLPPGGRTQPLRRGWSARWITRSLR